MTPVLRRGGRRGEPEASLRYLVRPFLTNGIKANGMLKVSLLGSGSLPGALCGSG